MMIEDFIPAWNVVFPHFFCVGAEYKSEPCNVTAEIIHKNCISSFIYNVLATNTWPTYLVIRQKLQIGCEFKNSFAVKRYRCGFMLQNKQSRPFLPARGFLQIFQILLQAHSTNRRNRLEASVHIGWSVICLHEGSLLWYHNDSQWFLKFRNKQQHDYFSSTTFCWWLWREETRI